MKRGLAARGISLLFALLLTAAYFALPAVKEGFYQNNSGRKKLTLEEGESYSWHWTPEMEGTRAVTLMLSGMKKAQDVTVYAEMLDAQGAATASLEQPVAALGEEGDSLRLTGDYQGKETYTLRVWTSGEGALKLKGEEREEDQSFYPMLSENASYETRNPVLLYFAAGALLLSLIPVWEAEQGRDRLPRKNKSFLEKALPWAAFVMIVGIGMLVVTVKPMFSPGEDWSSWDEDTHWDCVKSMSLFQEDGVQALATNLITWNPGYVPLAIGYNAGRIFTGNEETLYHVSVAFSVVFYGLMVALAVRHAPRYKMTFLVAGTLPTLLFLMTSASYDTVVTGSLLLGTALILESIHREERVSPLRGMTMAAILIFGTVAKPAYSVAILLLWMIPAERFGGRGKAWAYRGFALLALVWCVLALVMPGAYEAVSSGDGGFAGTSVSRQTEYMLAHPVEGGLKPVRYVFQHPRLLLWEGISHWAYLGNEHSLSTAWLWMLLAAAPLCAVGETWEGKSLLTPGRRGALVCTALAAEIILAYGQYLASSAVGGELEGMQGRYFMPLWGLAALAVMWPQLIRKRVGRAGDWLAAAVYLVCLSGNLWNAVQYMQRTGLL